MHFNTTVPTGCVQVASRHSFSGPLCGQGSHREARPGGDFLAQAFPLEQRGRVYAHFRCGTSAQRAARQVASGAHSDATASGLQLWVLSFSHTQANGLRPSMALSLLTAYTFPCLLLTHSETTSQIKQPSTAEARVAREDCSCSAVLRGSRRAPACSGPAPPPEPCAVQP